MLGDAVRLETYGIAAAPPDVRSQPVSATGRARPSRRGQDNYLFSRHVFSKPVHAISVHATSALPIDHRHAALAGDEVRRDDTHVRNDHCEHARGFQVGC